MDKIGRLSGEIRAFAGVVFNQQNNVTISADPQYPALEAGLLDLIRYHPVVKDDVLALLNRLDMMSTAARNGATYQPAMIEGTAIRESEIEMAASE